MAKRRCLGIDLFESEEFQNLSDGAKVLYIHFVLKADDEGVVINPQLALRLRPAGKKRLAELMEKEFILCVCGVYVVRHWNVINKINPSKMTKTVYREAREMLFINEKMEYELLSPL